MSKLLHLVSLGCTKNLVDSEVMLGKLAEYEITDDATIADVIIVNTCGFIEAAKSESISTVLELHSKRKSNSILVMSGCLSQRYKDELQKQMPEVDIFTGVGDYEQIDKLIESKQSRFTPQVYLATEKSPRVITGSNYHAYIKISEGCNQNCSFCAIPSFKGRLKSRSVESIVSEVRALVRRGYKDFSFISQDSSSYGRDFGKSDGLIELIEAIESVDGVCSARILYLYPTTVSLRLIDKIYDSRVFQSYYDIPLQHIDDKMLKIMKRGFGESKTRELLDYIASKGKDIFVRTSVIVGHPGEDEEAFWKLCNYIQEYGFDRVTVFAYSNEEDTTAFDMPQIDQEIIEKRVETIGDIAKDIMYKSLDRDIGKDMVVAIDGVSSEHDYLLSSRPLLWASEIDGEILINDKNDIDIEVGVFYTAHITQRADSYLMATLKQRIEC